MIKGKIKGNVWERSTKKHLISRGFFVVKQGASLFPDLIAINRDGKVFFIECKSAKNYITSKEKQMLRDMARQYSISPFVCYPKYGVYSLSPDNFVFQNLDNVIIDMELL